MADLTVNSLSITTLTTLPIEANVGIFASVDVASAEVLFSTESTFAGPYNTTAGTFTGGSLVTAWDFN